MLLCRHVESCGTTRHDHGLWDHLRVVRLHGCLGHGLLLFHLDFVLEDRGRLLILSHNLRSIQFTGIVFRQIHEALRLQIVVLAVKISIESLLEAKGLVDVVVAES